jgi:hypothetical protein
MNESFSSGQSHLINPIKDTQEIGSIPSCLEPFGMDAHTRGFFLTQQIEADVAQNCEIFVGMTEPNPRFILSKGHIQHPMQAVFNSPVVSDSGGEGFDRRKTE